MVVENPDAVTDAEARMPLGEQVFSEIFHQQSAVHQHPNETSAEHLNHKIQAAERNMIEHALTIESII